MQTITLNLYCDKEYSRSIKSIKMGDGVVGAKDSIVYIKTNNYRIDIGSVDMGFNTFQYAAAVEISGDFVDNFSGAFSHIKPMNDSASLNIAGTLSSNNSSGTVFSVGQGASNFNYSLGGIANGSGRFTTSSGASYAGDTGLTIIHLTGDGLYTTSSKISDTSWASSMASNIDTTGAFSFIKEGLGTQYIRGQVWYRGDTTVKAGRLYIKADNSGRSRTAPVWGIGALNLEGGYFGSVGASGDIGLTYVKSLAFKGGALSYNFSGTDSDKISILATEKSELIVAETSELFKFEFVVDEGLLIDNPYKILEWDSTLGLLDYDLSKAQVLIVGRDDVSALLSYAADGSGINATFVIPEPSTYAALFGALALLTVFVRRRK